MTRQELEQIIRDILTENKSDPCPVKHAALPGIMLSENDRMDTGTENSQVFTKDLFSLEESPRLGAGLMEMTATTFSWELSYDEVDYIIEGELTVYCNKSAVTAKAGEVILIPKGSKILFSAPKFARFLYVTYPADWQNCRN